MEFTTLLKDLGTLVNLPELSPDENGFCRLSLDKVIIDIKADAEEKHLMLFAEIAPFPMECSSDLVKEILGANFLFNGTNGATLALNTENKTITLQQKEALALLDVDNFSEMLNNFATTVENWQALIADFQQKSPDTAEANPSELTMNSSYIRL